MGRFSEKKKRISNWPLFSAGVLLCLVLISTHFTAGIFARYTAVNSGSDAARVAAFVFKKADKAGSEHFIDLNGIQNPGDNVTYEFTVSNESGDKVCEVALDYAINLKLVGSIPLQCTLTKTGGASVEGDVEAGNGVAEIGVTDTFDAAVSRTDSYTLFVIWPSDRNSAAYANGVGVAECTLVITAEQKD